MRHCLLIALCVFGFAVAAPTQAIDDIPSPEEQLAARLAKTYADYQSDVGTANATLNTQLTVIEQNYLLEQRRALASRNRKALIAAYIKKLEETERARLDWQDATEAAAELLAMRRASAYYAYAHSG